MHLTYAEERKLFGKSARHFQGHRDEAAKTDKNMISMWGTNDVKVLGENSQPYTLLHEMWRVSRGLIWAFVCCLCRCVWQHSRL